MYFLIAASTSAFDLIVLTLILTLFNLLFSQNKITAEEKNENQLQINADVGLLMEFSTGQIIYSKNINKKKYPASMTKMMGLFLILEKIKDNSKTA